MSVTDSREGREVDQPIAGAPAAQDDQAAHGDGDVAVTTAPQETTAVVSCPVCLYQYRAPISARGKIGRCDMCGAYFAIAIAEWHLPDGEPVLLTDPIVPRYAFFQEGCATFARHAIELLKLAGEPVTVARILMIVVSLPRQDDRWLNGYCNRVVRLASDRATTNEERARLQILFNYFTEHIPSLSHDALDMLTAALRGVLGHDELEPPPPPPPPAPVRRRGLLRWLGKLAGRTGPQR